MKKMTIIGSTLFTLISCSKDKGNSSATKEQIDRANNLISRYGLQEMPTYDDLLKFKSVMTKKADGSQRHPWTDIYWSTQEKGLARRWDFLATDTNADYFNKGTEINLFFSTHVDALAEPEISYKLSPAEKFDIVYRGLKGLTLNADNADLKKIQETAAKRNSFGADDASFRKFLASYGEVFKQSNGADSLNALSPLASEGIRNFLAKTSNPNNQLPELPHIKSDPKNESLTDWSWEGICHGWAPAAIMTEEPKRAVKLEIPVAGAKKSILFTEGDIRGLLSKVWADAKNPEQFFIGRRCNKNMTDDPEIGIPRNAEGRGVTGSMKYQDSQGVAKEGQFTIVQDYPRSEGFTSLYRVILESELKKDQPKYAYLIQKNEAGGTAPSYRLVFEEAQAFAEVEKGVKAPASVSSDVKSVEIFGCWDVNPASLHTVLVENIGKKNLGFVMDRTQTGQVWNQPITAADFEIGALRSVADLGNSDPARFYRAPGTAFIAEVKSTVFWTYEPGEPMYTYSDEESDQDAVYVDQTVYTYTLEFDANKRLIGGEWGSLSNMSANQTIPDFLFGFSKATEPNLSKNPVLKEGYERIIKKIHACSLKDKADGEETVFISPDGDEEELLLPYSNCSL